MLVFVALLRAATMLARPVSRQWYRHASKHACRQASGMCHATVRSKAFVATNP